MLPNTQLPRHDADVTFNQLIDNCGAPSVVFEPNSPEQREQSKREREDPNIFAALNFFRPPGGSGTLRPLSAFHADPRYGGDLHRADMAWAKHAAGLGLTFEEIEEALRKGRDLSKKGNEKNQEQWDITSVNLFRAAELRSAKYLMGIADTPIGRPGFEWSWPIKRLSPPGIRLLSDDILHKY